jgi:tetratricopeptide (TPR) repeat protein
VGAGLFLLAILFQAPLPPASGEELQRGKNAYDRGEFGRAIEIIRPLLYPDLHLQSDNQIVLAHRILGVAYLFEKKQEEAKAEFRKLLQLSPDYRFNPLLDPPEVVDFFNLVREEYSGQLARLEAKRRELEQARRRDIEACEKARAGPAVIEKRVGRNSFAVSFIPFGAGQFQNGHRKKGWTFLAVESVLGAASVAAFATNLAVYGFRPQRPCRYDVGATACPPDAIDHTEEDRSRLLTQVQVITGAAFFGAVVLGILDAIYYYRPETALDGADAPQPAKLSSQLRVSPAIMNRSVGPALSFRF